MTNSRPFNTVVQHETSHASITLQAVGPAYRAQQYGSEQPSMPVTDETERLSQAMATLRRHYSAQGYQDMDPGPSLGRVREGTVVPRRFNTPARTGRRPQRRS